MHGWKRTLNFPLKKKIVFFFRYVLPHIRPTYSLTGTHEGALHSDFPGSYIFNFVFFVSIKWEYIAKKKSGYF